MPGHSFNQGKVAQKISCEKCGQKRPKSDISGALGPIDYITLKAFAMASLDGTKCKTCFGVLRMILHAH